MIAEVDQIIEMAHGQLIGRDRSVESRDAVGECPLDRRARQQPCLCTGSDALNESCLNHGKGNDEVAETKRHRCDESSTHYAQDVAYSVVSGIPRSTNAS